MIEIVLGLFGALGSVIAVISYYDNRRAKKIEFEKMLKERDNFVKTSIIKINNEFEPVTICSANNYDFKLNRYTVFPKNR